MQDKRWNGMIKAEMNMNSLSAFVWIRVKRYYIIVEANKGGGGRERVEKRRGGFGMCCC